MARVVVIDNIISIKDAENIELAFVEGWKVIVKKNTFSIGEKAVYFEMDSMIPVESVHFNFMKSRASKLYLGVRYHKIKTVKLLGTLSQGLLLTLNQLNLKNDLELGSDVSDMLGVLKFDEELYLNDKKEGHNNFPSFLERTDQERIQNLSSKISKMEGCYEVSMKIDGASISAFKMHGKIGIASKKTIIKDESSIIYAKYKEGLINSGIWAYLEGYKGDIAFQGEFVGPDICNNQEGFESYDVLVFDIYDIGEKRYWLSKDRLLLCKEFNIKHVPIICYKNVSKLDTVDKILEFADGPSLNSKHREGLVFKKTEYSKNSFQITSFKAISNKWLLIYDKI